MDSNNDLSISMLIENDIKKDIIDYDDKGYKPLPLKSSFNNISDRKLYQWVPDNNVVHCTECSTDFSLLVRKHHCRNCGKIFCNLCSNYFIKIPTNIDTVPKENNLYDIKTYFEYFNLTSEEQRVCKHCYHKIFELRELNKTIKIFDLLDLDILDYKNISLVCKSWNKISSYYFSQFREIQYYFSDHKFNKKERDILYRNRFNMIGHSKWILQIILSVDWNSDNNLEEKKNIFNIVKNTKRNTSCWQMMCTRFCCNKLNVEDIIIILSKKYIYVPLIKYIIQLLHDISDTELNCYMSTIVGVLTFYKNYTVLSKEIEDFLISKCINNISLSNQLFWSITRTLMHPDNYKYFSAFRQKLVKVLDKNTYKLFQNGYDFTLNLIKIASKTDDDIVEKLSKYLEAYSFSKSGFNLPINFDKSFQNIDISKIRAIDSKTKPIILPCTYGNDKIFNIMLKNEDIRKEEIIMKIISLMDFFLKQEEKLDLFITVYNILPISNEYGFIEFVPESNTLYSIKENMMFSIQNFILEKNPDMSVNTFRDKISKSCAAYCVITYLLGIGDRHLDNIMITDDGRLFHIDFGYILGFDPKPICPDIRLTAEMIDAMGGINSLHYKKFKTYCGRAYNCLRRHAPIFYTLLLSLTESIPNIDIKITKAHIKNHIYQRFIPGENYHTAFKQFIHKLDSNSNTFSEDIIDFFHKKCKSKSDSKSNSIPENVPDIINKATDVAYDFSNKIHEKFNSLRNSVSFF